MPSSKSVLIVDDEPLVRRVLRRLLADLSVTQLHEAVNGKEGVDSYRRLKPDMVLLDVNMPGMDGFETLQMIKEQDASAKVIMISASLNRETKLRALRMGASNYLRKDLPRSALKPLIQQFL